MRAGTLDRRITIRRVSTADDDYGEPIKTWSDFIVVPAAWRNATTSEKLAALQIGDEVTDIFRIRFSADAATITPMDRLIFDGKDYNITGAVQIGRREGIKITATARAA